MIKVSELTGAQLDYYVARAQDWRQEVLPVTQAVAWFDERGRFTDTVKDYRPSEEWALGGPLIEKYNLNTSVAYSGYQKKSGHAAWSNDLDLDYGNTPLQAICRAVVRAAFGDEVEEVAG